MEKKNEDANKKYLDSLFDKQDEQQAKDQKQLNFSDQTAHEAKEYNPESELDYTNVDLTMLPSGRFYKQGTKIKIRPAKVYEIQAYSVVDDKNFLDVTELASCQLVT